MLAATPTLGIIVGPIVAAIILIICAAWSVYFAREDEYGPAWFGVAAAVVVIILTGIFTWPWKAEYHTYQPREGTVTAISNRFLPNGESVEQKFVVTLEGDPQPYAIQDTRAALLKRGDYVKLACIKQYEWGSSAHGYNCRWNG